MIAATIFTNIVFLAVKSFFKQEVILTHLDKNFNEEIDFLAS